MILSLRIWLISLALLLTAGSPPIPYHPHPVECSSEWEEPSIEDLLTAAEIRHDLPAGILHAIAWVESRMNPDVIGALGEIGLMQLHPRYHDVSGGISGQIETAARYLRMLLDRLGCLDLALSAYNQGPSNPIVGSYAQRVRIAWKGVR